MRCRAILYGLLVLLFVRIASAEPRSLLELDDFVDPDQRTGNLFISRLIVGVARGSSDDFRPLHQDVATVRLANSFYWRNLQVAYKHDEARSQEGGPIRVRRCGCADTVYFPTPPPAGAAPAAPPPGRRETMQFSIYGPSAGGERPRYRLSWSRQSIATVISEPDGTTNRRSGREQSFGLDADTHIRLGRHDAFGSFLLFRTVRSGTTDDRRQTGVAYTSRFPVVPLPKGILLRAALTVGRVSDRGGTGINVVTPLIEVFRHSASRVNLRLLYSPERLRDGNGWQTHHQVAVLVDYAPIVWLAHSR